MCAHDISVKDKDKKCKVICDTQDAHRNNKIEQETHIIMPHMFLRDKVA